MSARNTLRFDHMGTVRKYVPALIVFAIIFGALYGLLSLFYAMLDWIMSQESQVAAAIIAFAGTVIAGIGAVVLSQQRTKSREIAEAHRQKKTDLYLGFITEIVGTLRKSKDSNGGLSDEHMKEFEEFIFDFTSKVMLWGSPRVLRHYGDFRKTGQRSDPNVLLIVDDILQAMRKDLGLSNWALSRGDLIKMLLTDPESLDELLTQKVSNKDAKE